MSRRVIERHIGVKRYSSESHLVLNLNQNLPCTLFFDNCGRKCGLNFSLGSSQKLEHTNVAVGENRER